MTRIWKVTVSTNKDSDGSFPFVPRKVTLLTPVRNLQTSFLCLCYQSFIVARTQWPEVANKPVQKMRRHAQDTGPEAEREEKGGRGQLKDRDDTENGFRYKGLKMPSSIIPL
jgi:hypothetical protein